ncbi:putative membrane protein YesL [Mobilisporobacter senegalensis]|uniref:Putative membrane protein YesL n=1 Tax=Mobilisporobacter senegalensis TaxID=1329262 RepID=A0A3N1XF15_9FIRM|nr:DUF624 domain-containing protein [Mobilisporobacter senegalensis]ROR25320.1 putative membrane protein YesL [Mobilisporobacter senegalensis]
MSSFFNLDNPIFTFLGKLFDIMVLSLVYIICCIPVITIGSATTALYYTIVKVIRKNRGYLMKEFFRSFKENFKIGTISWIFILLFSLILYVNNQITQQMEGTMGVVLYYTYRSAAILILITTLYLFPVLSRFQLGVWQLFKTSFFLSIKHLPSTILLVLLAVIFGLASYLTIILILFAPALCLYVSSFLLERVFKKYIPKQDESEFGESKLDQWYLD